MTKSRLDEMETFAIVATTGSFSEAARRLGISPSAVSKLMTRLERRLGVRLINRSTHGLSLTAEGDSYSQSCRSILDTIEEAEAKICGIYTALKGTLRVSTSGAFAYHYIAPRLPAFRDRYPHIKVDILISDNLIDLVEERVDVALRIGMLKDSALHFRKIGTTATVYVAAPEYLGHAGTPKCLEDLADHNMLGYPLNHSRHSRENDDNVNFATDSGEMLRHLALQGLGIARMASFHVKNDLSEGRLVQILKNESAGSFDTITALFPAHRQPAPRISAFIDHLIETDKSTT
ncbi:hypothetical protein CAI21_17495 [Alkalilimnicola ehrlichii]|uniref:HTH lysR-type domain-containing protein n=1 Tax=Alkalilimnicola ehrlichii TaxID=351052 RepID=A0A3E0WKE4_9GAMM|nr:LysR family transcriptional regulator [Alkalilimnicola ehrlichii]RFA26272.1 hypothetical protein CAI21_17495 [Alkalilimnicola ehrlichii]RFA33258.1 hypothetical protein CAL65_17980 [Alkalilimnicola ehrlichii]